MVISSFAIGLLAQKLFYLGFVDAILTCLFFNLIGVIPVCYFSTFGPRFGLRQMVLSRFWFGWYGVKLIAFFNVLACIGWSSVNSIVGAQLLHAVNNDVPGWAGILIIAVGTLLVTFFGYKVVHAYEFWSWIPTFIVFLIVLGEFAHSGAFVNLPMGVGTSELGGVLSFGSVIYGFATGWTSYAADYTVYQPVSQSRTKIFFSVWIGLMIPLLFTEFLGIAIMTATTINDGKNIYIDGYNTSGTGGLLAAVLFGPLGGFGKFCLVILALSIIANNCPNIYSVALTMQVLGRWTQRIPRFVWTTIATAVYIAIAIPGYSHFEEVLENFMNFIGTPSSLPLPLPSSKLIENRLLARHLRRRRLRRTPRLPPQHVRLRSLHVRPAVQTTSRSRCRVRLLLRRRRHGDGYESGVVCGADCAACGGGAVWWGCRV